MAQVGDSKNSISTGLSGEKSNISKIIARSVGGKRGSVASGKIHTKIEGSIRHGVQFGTASKPRDPDIIEIKTPGRSKGSYVLERDSGSGQYELIVTEVGRPGRGGRTGRSRGSSTTSRVKQPKVAPDLEGSIYLSSDDAFIAIEVIIAMNGLLDQLGYGPLVPQTVERGSWFATFKAKAKAGVSTEQAKVLAEQVRRGAEAYAEKQEIENLESMARSAAVLMRAVPASDTAAFDLQRLRIVTQDRGGKRHWVIEGETSRAQAIRTVDQAKAMSEKVFEEYYSAPDKVEADESPAGEIEQ